MPVEGPRWDVGELEQSPLPLTYPLLDDVVREDAMGLGTACGLLLLLVVWVVAIALNHKDDNADTHQ